MTTFAQLRNSLQSFLTHHLADLEIAERIEALTWYCQGLGLEIRHKTALGIAARLQPDNVQACRQRMQRALQRGRFSHDEVFQRLQQTVFAAELMEAYCIDDTGFAKDGTASAGVQRQYSGTLGKVGNCQIAVTLHAASETFGACLGAQLYLPSIWAEDRDRCRRAGIPDSVECLPKWQIALDMLESALNNGGPRLPVIADAAYGDSRDLREGIRNAGCHYVVAISSNTNVWKPGVEPSVPPRTGTRGPRPSVARGPNNIKPVRVDKLAAELWDAGNFLKITWKQNSRGTFGAKFCAIRIRSAERRTKRKPPGPQEWLLIERDEKQESGFKYYLSSLPQSTTAKELVRLAKLRWRIEADYRELKQNLGLAKYEGRTWGGTHRHIAMAALMHAFLSLNREDFSPGAYRECMDLGRLPPSFGARADVLVRPLPNLSAGV